MIHRSKLWEKEPAQKEFDLEGLSLETLASFKSLLSAGRNDETAIGRLNTMTANDFFRACAIGYKACGFDGKWLVLDAEHTNMGTEGLFLVSLNLIGGEDGSSVLFRDIGDVSVSFSNRGEAYAQDHPGVTDYQGSDLQRWHEDFLNTHFSEAEQQAAREALELMGY